MRINSKIPFILPLALFFLSGMAGVRFSYSPEYSLTKFMLIVFGIFLYIVIVMLRGEDQLLTRLTQVFLVAAALFAFYFDTQNDFTAHPSKFNILNQLGLLFNNLMPRLQLFNLDRVAAAGDMGINLPRDTVVGILEIALPLNIAVILDVWTRNRRISIMFTISAL
ncbi:MAG: hypothetical protein PHX78_03425, partial [bacterium]|nr:hypothetical protein [bacterium]